MGILNSSSSASRYKGFEYYKAKKVISFSKINEEEFEGKVLGSYNNHYDVIINEKHVRKSSCNCPHAAGSRIICKHMVALFFEAYPNELKKYVKDMQNQYYEVKAELDKFEHKKDRQYKQAKAYVDSLSIQQLKIQLINYMLGDDEEETEYEDDLYAQLAYYEEFADMKFDVSSNVKLKLSTVVDCFESLDQFNTIYINIKTNEIVDINPMFDPEYNDDIYFQIEDNRDDYIMLPSQYELHNYNILTDFVDLKIDNIEIQRKFYEKISGKNAFSNFKRLINYYNLTDKWCKFKKNAYAKKARDFLYDNDVEFIDDL